jgi:chromosome segregation ATPase
MSLQNENDELRARIRALENEIACLTGGVGEQGLYTEIAVLHQELAALRKGRSDDIAVKALRAENARLRDSLSAALSMNAMLEIQLREARKAFEDLSPDVRCQPAPVPVRQPRLPALVGPCESLRAAVLGLAKELAPAPMDSVRRVLETENRVLAVLHGRMQILAELQEEIGRIPGGTERMIAAGLRTAIDDRKRQEEIEKRIARLTEAAERIAQSVEGEVLELSEEVQQLRREVEKGREANAGLAAAARKTFVAVRSDARAMEAMIRECWESMVKLKTENRIVRERIGIEHPLLEFLERLESVGRWKILQNDPPGT